MPDNRYGIYETIKSLIFFTGIPPRLNTIVWYEAMQARRPAAILAECFEFARDGPQQILTE